MVSVGQVGGDLVQLVHEDVEGRLGGGWTEQKRRSVLANVMNNARDVFVEERWEEDMLVSAII